MKSIKSKIDEYIVIKTDIIDLINQIKPLLTKALQLKSNINKGSASFSNFKNRLKNIQNIQKLQLNQLNNSNLKTLLQPLKQLLNKLVNTNVYVNDNGTAGNRTTHSIEAIRTNTTQPPSKKNIIQSGINAIKKVLGNTTIFNQTKNDIIRSILINPNLRYANYFRRLDVDQKNTKIPEIQKIRQNIQEQLKNLKESQNNRTSTRSIL